MVKKLLKIHPTDNVAVALVNISAGETIDFDNDAIHILSDVKAKHKIALNTLNAGDRIIMYGVLVGTANGVIEKGDVLTTENVKHQSEKVPEEPKILVGRLLMLKNGRTERFWDTTEKMDKWAQKMFGCFFRWYFVKTEILKR